MAKVKIQGHASGTGILTVTAPNTSTDRTITLPDSTDTLAVNGDVTNKLPLAGGTMTGDLVVSADVDITGSLNGTSGALDIKNEANNQNVFIKTTSSGSEVTALKIHSGGTLELPSGGLRVGGAAAANTLEDYEEGTWTPAMRGSAGSVGSAANNGGMGSYVKVGNLVHVTFSQYMTNLGSWSGNLEVGGLPFTCSHVSVGSIANFPSIEVDAEMRGVGVPANLTQFNFYKGSRLDVRVPWSEIVTSYYMTIAATYRV